MAQNVVGSIVGTQVTQYQRDNYPLYVTLLQYYYKFLAQQGNPTDLTANLLNYRSSSTTLDSFLGFFSSEYLDKFPATIAADKRLLLKRVTDLYRTKGTAESISLFFKLAYNVEATVTLPQKQMMVVSGSKWVQPFSVRCAVNTGDISAFNSEQLVTWSNASGSYFIRSTSAKSVYGNVIEIFFKKTQDIIMNAGDIIKIKNVAGDTIFTGTAINTANKFVINNGGSNFKVGQIFTVPGSYKNSVFQVSGVTSTGAITSITPIDFGYVQPTNQSVTVSPYSVTPQSSAVTISKTGSVWNLGIIDTAFTADNGSFTAPQAAGSTDAYFGNDYLQSYASYPQMFIDTGTGDILTDGNNNTVFTPVYIQPYFSTTYGEFNTSAQQPTSGLTFNSSITYQQYVASLATLTLNSSAINAYPGSYQTLNGHSSESTIKLQDSFYYQLYSYVVNSPIQINEFQKALIDLIHPVGEVFFSNLGIDSTLNLQSKVGVFVNQILGLKLYDGVTPGDAVTKSAKAVKTDSVTPVDSNGKRVTTPKADGSTVTDSVAKKPKKAANDSTTTSDAYIKTIRLNKTDSQLATDAAPATAENYVDPTYLAGDYITSYGGADNVAKRQTTVKVDSVTNYDLDNSPSSLFTDGNGNSLVDGAGNTVLTAPGNFTTTKYHIAAQFNHATNSSMTVVAGA